MNKGPQREHFWNQNYFENKELHQNQAFLRNWLRPKLVLQISDYGHTRVFVLFFVMRSRFLKQIKEFWAVCCVPVIYLPLTTCANRERASGEKKNESSPLALYIVGSNWDRIWAILWENFSWMRCFFLQLSQQKLTLVRAHCISRYKAKLAIVIYNGENI